MTAFAFTNTGGVRMNLMVTNAQLMLEEGDSQYVWTGFEEASRSYTSSGSVGTVLPESVPGLLAFLNAHAASARDSDRSSLPLVTTQTSCLAQDLRATNAETQETQESKLDQGRLIEVDRHAVSPLLGNSETHGRSRLESLIEEQNALLLRQVEMAEKNNAKQNGLNWHRNSPRDLLKTLDGNARSIFRQWWTELRSTSAIYVCESKKLLKMQAATSRGELVHPFDRDARRAYSWPQYYRHRARPVHGAENGAPESENSASAPESGPYNIDDAFGDLRLKQAWELQMFVCGHQQACVDSLVQDLTLTCQVKKLQDQIAAWTRNRGAMYPSQVQEDLQFQAKTFVQMVHPVEIHAAEQKINEQELPCPVKLLTVLRVLFVMLTLSAPYFMSHELLMQVAATLFALGCGLALLWEDVVVLSVRFLLGQSLQRLETARTNATNMNLNLPIIFWQ